MRSPRYSLAGGEREAQDLRACWVFSKVADVEGVFFGDRGCLVGCVCVCMRLCLSFAFNRPLPISIHILLLRTSGSIPIKPPQSDPIPLPV